MKKGNVKEILIPTITLFIICLISAAILAGLNSVTSPIISKQNEESAIASMQEVLPDAVSFGDTTENGDCEYNVGTDANGNTAGYVITTTGKSYGGTISVMTGIGADGLVKGVVILEIDDTPGLGMNAKNDYFLNQYKGASGEFSVTKNGVWAEDADENIDAITSATITSTAVTKAVNAAVACYNEITGGENNG